MVTADPPPINTRTDSVAATCLAFLLDRITARVRGPADRELAEELVAEVIAIDDPLNYAEALIRDITDVVALLADRIQREGHGG